MRIQLKIIIAVSACLFNIPSIIAREDTPAQRIKKKVFQNYDKTIECEGVVRLMISQKKIFVDESHEQVTLGLVIMLVWDNPQLTWDPEEFDHVTTISIDSKKIWLPNLIPLVNHRTQKQEMNRYKVPIHTFRSLLNNQGESWYFYSTTLITHCQINTENWPIDIQHCYLKFGIPANSNYSVTYFNVKMSPSYKPDNWNVDLEVDNTNYYQNDSLFKEIVTMNVTLTRQGSMYATIYTVPAIIIMAVTVTLFWLKPQNPNRLILLVVFLPTLNYLLQLMVDVVPHSGLAVPSICKYLGTVSAITTFCIIETIFIRVLLSLKTYPLWLYKANIQISKMNMPKCFNICHKNEYRRKLEEMEVEVEHQPESDNSVIEEEKKIDVLENTALLLDNIVFIIVLVVYGCNTVLLVRYM